MAESQLFFHNGKRVNLSEILIEIRNFLEEDPKGAYSLVIGTDSHEKEKSGNKKNINAVTAIVVHRKGYGGRYFWKRKTVSGIVTLRDKIYAETLASLDFAREFVPLLKKDLNGTLSMYNLEIHVDVGEHGDTRDMIKEVVGMVTGFGFVARTKPNSYAASYVADRHT